MTAVLHAGVPFADRDIMHGIRLVGQAVADMEHFQPGLLSDCGCAGAQNCDQNKETLAGAATVVHRCLPKLLVIPCKYPHYQETCTIFNETI